MRPDDRRASPDYISFFALSYTPDDLGLRLITLNPDGSIHAVLQRILTLFRPHHMSHDLLYFLVDQVEMFVTYGD